MTSGSVGTRTGDRLRIITDDAFSRHSLEGHPERPERLHAITARLRVDPGVRGVPWFPADSVTLAHLEAVHPAGYVQSIEQLSASGGGWVDADTYCTADSYRVAMLAAGGAVQAGTMVCTGASVSAFALVRPPGHHATADRAMGFCLFNNVAVAVRALQRDHGVERVAIVDIDVHHGNGLQDIFWDDPSVLYCSLHQYPFYPGTGAASERGGDRAVGTTVNVPLPAGTDGPMWLRAFHRTVAPALTAFAPELIVVSAGYDGHAADPLAQWRLDSGSYATIAERIGDIAVVSAGGRQLWVLEGGYDLDALSECASATTRVLAGPAS